MKVSERIKLAMKNKGYSQSELSRQTGIARSTISEWVRDLYEPKQDNIYVLAEALGVNPLWLMGVSDVMETKTPLTDIYNQLNNENQVLVYDYANDLLDLQINEEQSVYLVGQTAAGAGVIYGDIQYDEIKTTVPKGADYALTVKGDSMEPTIEDGSIIFYREQPVLENGEIGIIEINREEVTCKKFYAEDGKYILRSINPKYDDMVFTDNIRIIGKVIL